MKVMLIVGARPNFMKAASIFHAMRADKSFDLYLVHTGQHYDQKMSEIFFKELGLPEPDVDLGVGSGTHTEQTARIMLALEQEIVAHVPDLVMVVGDVNSTLAASLVAAKYCIPLAHVEAGLRSFDRTMPEEINRIVTDSLSSYLFTPSPDANANLEREGIEERRIFLVGNVMIDTLLRFQALAASRQTWRSFDLEPRKYCLLTLHRPSNVDEIDSLKQLTDVLMEITQRIPVLFPIHPRTRANLFHYGLMEEVAKSNTILSEPLGYLEFQSLLGEARLVMTDSGGVQEETTVLGVPCLTLRENTERPITISEGTNRLVGMSKAKILAELDEILARETYTPKRPALWDGRAAERIVQVLRDRD